MSRRTPDEAGFVLPLALAIPLWHGHYRHGQGAFLAKGLVAGLVLGLVIFSAWLMPVINILGLEEVREIGRAHV